jgi:hypothetical protein
MCLRLTMPDKRSSRELLRQSEFARSSSIKSLSDRAECPIVKITRFFRPARISNLPWRGIENDTRGVSSASSTLPTGVPFLGDTLKLREQRSRPARRSGARSAPVKCSAFLRQLPGGAVPGVLVCPEEVERILINSRSPENRRKTGERKSGKRSALPL